MGIWSSNCTENLVMIERYRVHLPGNVTLEFFRTKEMLHVPKTCCSSSGEEGYRIIAFVSHRQYSVGTLHFIHRQEYSFINRLSARVYISTTDPLDT